MKQQQILSGYLVQLITACIFFTSCTTYMSEPFVVSETRQKKQLYYVPMAPHTPLLNTKKDMELNLMFTGSGKYSAWDLQAAYLPTKHFGIMAGVSGADKETEEADGTYLVNDIYFKSTRYELGAGYITGAANGFHFEAYGGAGVGKLSNSHYTGDSEIKLTHFFIQPAVAYVDKTVSLSLVSKVSGVNFKVNSSFQKEREPLNAAQIQLLIDKPFHIMLEPGLLLRAGWQHFKFNFGYNHSFDLTDPELQRGFSNFLIGATFQWNTGKKKW